MQVTHVAKKENHRANGRSSNNQVICSVLFTFNKYSEFQASLVICINATVGLWRMHCEQCLW